MTETKKEIKCEYYDFKKSAKELFNEVAENNEIDIDNIFLAEKYYFEDFEVYYNNGVSKVFYDETIEPNGANTFKINNDGYVFYNTFNGCLCYSNEECEHENIERYLEDWRNGDQIIRSGLDVFLNIINEDLTLRNIEIFEIESIEEY